MAVQITRVQFGSMVPREDEIVSFEWRSDEGKVGYSSSQSMVEFLEAGNRAYVADGEARVEVGVVKPSGGEPYLRTYADGDWTNNLLSLPTF